MPEIWLTAAAVPIATHDQVSHMGNPCPGAGIAPELRDDTDQNEGQQDQARPSAQRPPPPACRSARRRFAGCHVVFYPMPHRRHRAEPAPMAVGARTAPEQRGVAPCRYIPVPARPSQLSPTPPCAGDGTGPAGSTIWTERPAIRPQPTPLHASGAASLRNRRAAPGCARRVPTPRTRPPPLPGSVKKAALPRTNRCHPSQAHPNRNTTRTDRLRMRWPVNWPSVSEPRRQLTACKATNATPITA